jgi:hypothetical protein
MLSTDSIGSDVLLVVCHAGCAGLFWSIIWALVHGDFLLSGLGEERFNAMRRGWLVRH